MSPALMSAFLPLATYYASLYAYAHYLNYKYDWGSLKPSTVADEIAKALHGEPWSSDNLPNSVVVAPQSDPQAYLRVAYLMARVARYLGNSRLAEEAKREFERIKQAKGNSDIAAIMRKGGEVIQSAAQARQAEPVVMQALYLLGVSVKGRIRDIPGDIRAAGAYRLDPEREAEEGVRNVVNLPANLAKSAFSAYKSKKLQEQYRKRQKRLRYKRNLRGAVVGAAALALLFVVGRATK